VSLISGIVCLWFALFDGASLRGVVRDASGAPAPGAVVELVGGGAVRQTRSDPDGVFVLAELPSGPWRVRVALPGFRVYERLFNTAEVDIRLEVAEHRTTVTVGSEGATVEAKTTSSTTVDRATLATLPVPSLNDAILYTSPGVVADSNGFFHPLGDHAQVSYVIDGQPISDQRNKVFATSIPANAIQSMELIAGSPAAEYGDKTSLVVQATTRSGLGKKPAGSFAARYGSFGTIAEESTFAAGGPRWGNFIAFNAERTGRFLDSPEFRPIHDIGNTGTFFDRFDRHIGSKDAFHMNALAARNWLQVPNTYDQPNQDQRQKVVSVNVAPGYQRTLGANWAAAATAFYRTDHVGYFPSRNPLDDAPATVAQQRSLTNFGVRADLSRARGRHEAKAGLYWSETRLNERFTLGITDPQYAPELTRHNLALGGVPFEFSGRASIHQGAAFAQDSVTLGNWRVSAGLRFDVYDGLTTGSAWQPRLAAAYVIKATRTSIRAGYSRTMETPANENLAASSSTGPGGLAGSLFHGEAEQKAIALGVRHQFDAGFQQGLGRWAQFDVSYFRKYTRNAFDFDALFSTPITFPIGWAKSKLDGVSARIGTADLHGLRAFITMGHANARFFGPENGGVIFNSALSAGVYRQDHDQVYQQNANIRYQRSKDGWSVDFAWRYDSGLVVGAVNSLNDALSLTAAQQSAIGFYCGAEQSTLARRITACNSADYGARRIHVLPPAAENDDHNPPRAMPRHILNASAGNDNLFHSERLRTTARITVLNLSNRHALYNFLSPFSGTHWVAPRSYTAELGWVF
jgi:hypothetical protein